MLVALLLYLVLLGGMLYVCYRKLCRIEERLQTPPREVRQSPEAGQDSP